VTITATSAAVSTVAKSIVVTLAAATSNSRIPANAIVSGDLDASPNWVWIHDPGTEGTSQGTTMYPVAGVSSDNVAREFNMTYTSYGGELYHVSFANDKVATHFVYDAYVYVDDPSQLMNLEMDMNDVMTDGRTVILATPIQQFCERERPGCQEPGLGHRRSSDQLPDRWRSQRQRLKHDLYR
jgi:hypothetical protein